MRTDIQALARRLRFFCVLGAALLLPGAFAGGDPASTPPPIKPASEATITGRVMLQDGAPAPGRTVVARSTRYVSPTPAGEAVTGPDGRYTLRVNVGLAPSLFPVAPPRDDGFTVSLTDPGTGAFPLPSSRTVTLPDQHPDTVGDVNFILATGSQITVRVHDAQTGLPVPGLTVRWGSYSPASQTAGVTDAQGELRFRAHAQNNDYSQPNQSLPVDVEVDLPPNLVPAIEAAPGYGFSRSFQLLPLQNAVWDIKTYKVGAGTVPVTWRGVAVGPDGRPVPGAHIHIFRGWQENPKLLTDASGRFSWQTQRFHENESYSSPPQMYITASKGDLNVEQPLTPDETWDGIVIHLMDTPPAILTGTAVDPSGHPLAGVPVELNALPDLPVSNLPWSQTVGMTDAQGRFQLVGLTVPAGYTLRFGGWPQGPGSGDFGLTLIPPAFNSPLQLRPGERRDFGRVIVRHADGVITGRIVDAEDKPVTSNVSVSVRGAHTDVNPDLGQDGAFKAVNLVSEPLTLTVSTDVVDVKTNNTRQVTLATLPVQAGQRDVRVVVPAGSWEPPPPVPVRPRPATGPPSVAPGSGSFDFFGLWVGYDDQQNVTLYDLDGDIIWQGTFATLEGMRLALDGDRGTLQDAAGHAVWSGAVQNIPEYSIIGDRPPESENRQHVTVRDVRGRKLWSGVIADIYYPHTDFTQDRVSLLDANNRIQWTGRYDGGIIAYHVWGDNVVIPVLRPGIDPADWGFDAFTFFPYGLPYVPVPKGVVRLSVITRHAELQDLGGKVLWSGPVPLIALTYPVRAATRGLILTDHVLNLNGGGKFVAYDRRGQPLPDATVIYGKTQ